MIKSIKTEYVRSAYLEVYVLQPAHYDTVKAVLRSLNLRFLVEVLHVQQRAYNVRVKCTFI